MVLPKFGSWFVAVFRTVLTKVVHPTVFPKLGSYLAVIIKTTSLDNTNHIHNQTWLVSGWYLSVVI